MKHNYKTYNVHSHQLFIIETNGILWCVLPYQKQKSHENRVRRPQPEAVDRKYSNFTGALSYIFVTNVCYIFNVNCSFNLMWSVKLYTIAWNLVIHISLWSEMLHHVVLHVTTKISEEPITSNYRHFVITGYRKLTVSIRFGWP